MAWAEAYLHTKWHLDPSSRLATIDTDRKLGLRLLFLEGSWVLNSSSNTMLLGQRSASLPSGILIHPAILRRQIWAENWGLCLFGGGRAGSPSNTMWPGQRPTHLPSFILIRRTVWPQYTNSQTDGTDRQTGQWADRTGRRSDSIGRTVLQRIAQKLEVIWVVVIRMSPFDTTQTIFSSSFIASMLILYSFGDVANSLLKVAIFFYDKGIWRPDWVVSVGISSSALASENWSPWAMI